MRKEGERIYLKKIEVSEIDEQVMTWFDNEELMRYYTNSRRKIDKEGLIRSIKQGEEDGNNFTYGIYFKENDEIIGTLKIGSIIRVHKVADMATLLGNTAYHGKGLAVEAVKLGIKICFEDLDIRKLHTGMYMSNIPSIMAYVKAGWLVEGVLHGQFLVDGKNEDRVIAGCFNPKYFNQEELNTLKLKSDSLLESIGL